MGPGRVRQLPRGAARAPASAIRSTSSTSRRPSGPTRWPTARPSPIPTRSSAPTATPPWSTASPCSAGAWAASRRKPPCSASRSRCCIPEVIGFKLTGKLNEGVTATDLVLTVTQMLRKKGVVNKFVEFFGPGLDTMPLADRATIANMAPGIRRHLRLLPDRRRDHPLLDDDRPRSASRGTHRSLRQGDRPVPLLRCSRPGVHRYARTRPRLGRAVDGRPQASRGPHRAHRHQERLRQRARGRVQEAGRGCPSRSRRGPRLRSRPWRRSDRRHHELHQHVQPQRAHRRRPARPQRGARRSQGEAVGEDLAGAWIAGRCRVSREGGPAEVSR